MFENLKLMFENSAAITWSFVVFILSRKIIIHVLYVSVPLKYSTVIEDYTQIYDFADTYISKATRTAHDMPE